MLLATALTVGALASLTGLDLRGNLLETIHPDVFRSTPGLKALDLANNAFKALPLEAVRAVDNSLESIRLEGRHNIFHE